MTHFEIANENARSAARNALAFITVSYPFCELSMTEALAIAARLAGSVAAN
jgi:hypothetical protein